MSDTRLWPTLRGLVLPVYIPMVAGALGIGMLVPVLPLYLRDADLSFATTSLVLAAAGFGSMLGGLPAGGFLARVDERSLLALSLLAMAVSTAVVGLTTSVAALVAFRLTFGAGLVGLRLSRQTFIGNEVPPRIRGRAMSLVGGSFRLSLLVGPVLGGIMAESMGFTLTFVACGAVNAIGLIGIRARAADTTSAVDDGASRLSLFGALWRHRSVLVAGGLAPALVIAVRDGRYVVLPLIAAEHGLSVAAVGALVAVGTGADLLLFPVAGHLMDRYGRLHAMVPSFTLIACGLLILSIAGSTWQIGVAGAVMGIGNGIGSGTMLTLATDLAPPDARGQVLSGLAVLQDVGTFLGPLLVGVSAELSGLSTAALVLAAVMGFAIFWFVAVVGETRDLVHSAEPVS